MASAPPPALRLSIMQYIQEKFTLEVIQKSEALKIHVPSYSDHFVPLF